MKKQIAKIYKRREKAHEELLKCDVELDEILKGELMKDPIKEARKGKYYKRYYRRARLKIKWDILMYKLFKINNKRF